MSKNRKKYDGAKALVIKQLSADMGYTPDYIRKCVRGDVDNESSQEVVKEYTRRYKAICNALQ